MSTISAVQGASSNGRTHSTRAEDVAARVSLIGSATEDTARPVGADKAVEEIAAEEGEHHLHICVSAVLDTR